MRDDVIVGADVHVVLVHVPFIVPLSVLGIAAMMTVIVVLGRRYRQAPQPAFIALMVTAVIAALTFAASLLLYLLSALG